MLLLTKNCFCVSNCIDVAVIPLKDGVAVCAGLILSKKKLVVND